MPNGQLWYFMSRAITDRATLKMSTSTYSVLKVPKLGTRLNIFEQYWQRLLQRQQRANSEVLTLSSSSIYFSCFSTRRDGTVGLRSSLINCLCLRVFILEETSVNSWLVASSPGCHPPNLEGDISPSLVCSSALAVRMSCPKKALTRSNTGSPRTLWTDRSPDWQEKENMATSSKSVMSSGWRFFESDEFLEGRSLNWFEQDAIMDSDKINTTAPSVHFSRWRENYESTHLIGAATGAGKRHLQTWCVGVTATSNTIPSGYYSV